MYVRYLDVLAVTFAKRRSLGSRAVDELFLERAREGRSKADG